MIFSIVLAIFIHLFLFFISKHDINTQNNPTPSKQPQEPVGTKTNNNPPPSTQPQEPVGTKTNNNPPSTQSQKPVGTKTNNDPPPSTQPSQSPQSKNKFVGGPNLFNRPSPYLVQSTPQQGLPKQHSAQPPQERPVSQIKKGTSPVPNGNSPVKSDPPQPPMNRPPSTPNGDHKPPPVPDCHSPERPHSKPKHSASIPDYKKLFQAMDAFEKQQQQQEQEQEQQQQQKQEQQQQPTPQPQPTQNPNPRPNPRTTQTLNSTGSSGSSHRSAYIGPSLINQSNGGSRSD
ncbi:hypothetical protein DICPUDRAFT_154298 [Dictyostelium purpureum]|uniref:Uncharacterized protein n=1 Tax=Dictyostelium purpureum TaxID=5786 RepID=F0ZQZ3_DICPU|nr:uncharacterized protein DICPUDRAFT_154298 [Dictyostelium purpureum]EGC33629.1 hypothetical protein DICPUDRAFT_154298 [Dictyostelium purpureum]|eukprot:XP_003289849.1 hypothetical protein DICPUDRAFT_154298 [Dictyostelium purpureum]